MILFSLIVFLSSPLFAIDPLIDCVTGDSKGVIKTEIRRSAVNRPITVDICYDILKNPKVTDGKTLVMIHGIGNTGEIFRPLAETILNDSEKSQNISKIILLNMPGRNGSDIPRGAWAFQFADLGMRDYVTVVDQSLNHLSDKYEGVEGVVGHSLAGLTLQMLQARLKEEGKSIEEEYGAEKVILMASAPSRDVRSEWIDGMGAFKDGLGVLSVLSQPKWGSLFGEPSAEEFRKLFFTDKEEREIVHCAPTAEEVVDSRISARVPARVFREVSFTGRAKVPQGIFCGSDFQVIGFGRDNLFSIEEEKQIAIHIGCQGEGEARFTPVDEPKSTHSYFYYSPEKVIKYLDLP